MWDNLAEYWSLIVLGVVVVLSAITDIRSGKIYNAITYPAIVIGVVGHTILGGPGGLPLAGRIGLSGSVLGVAIGAGPLLLAWLAGGIGGGDVKLMAAVGAIGGARVALATLFYGFAVAAVMAIAVMVKKKIVKRTLGRILWFLYVALARGKPAEPASSDSPKIPFGVALCIGAAAAVTEVMLRGRAGEGILGF